MKKYKENIDVNSKSFLREGKLPNDIKPVVMDNVEEYLRSRGAIDTNELLKIINKFI